MNKINIFSTFILSSAILMSCFSCKKNASTNSATNNTINAADSMCLSYQELAQKDIGNNTMKYYVFGMITVTDSIVEKYATMNVQVISKNCAMYPEFACYNKVIDNYLQSKK